MKILRPLGLSLLTVSVAAYLHLGSGSALREWTTWLLGHDGRAVAEHALAGFGLPLALALLMFDALRRAELSFSSGRAQHIMLLCLHGAFALAYCAGSYSFEYEQAYLSVYGGAPRGYFQYGQLAADIIGALGGLALLAVRQRTSLEQPNSSSKPTPLRDTA
jgi:hypothetical protein